MTYRVTKGGLAVTADTAAELQIAIACLTEMISDEVVHDGRVEVNAPAWRVGGPRDEMPIGRAYLGDHVDGPYGVTADAMVPDIPRLAVVPDPGMPQHITVSRKNREVLDAIILFNEGVSTNSLETLLGIKPVIIASRIQALKGAGLVAKVPGHRRWVATTLARRAKLVTG